MPTIKKIKNIAILGIRSSWHHVAARQYFGQQIKVTECSTFRMLCETLGQGKVDYAVMAIENTLAGSILPNYSLIHNFKLRIIGETYIPIRLHLMALPKTKIEDVREICSHQMAIQQCSEFLETLEGVRIIEKGDTAHSAMMIRKGKLTGVAAIAGIQSAKEFNMQIISRNIHTHKKNFTRFLILRKKDDLLSLANKASICFTLKHKSGSLAEVLNLLAGTHINLTKIQSVPILGKPYQYSFHVDLEFYSTIQYKKAIKNVTAITSDFEILGTYKSEAKPVLKRNKL